MHSHDKEVDLFLGSKAGFYSISAISKITRNPRFHDNPRQPWRNIGQKDLQSYFRKHFSLTTRLFA